MENEIPSPVACPHPLWVSNPSSGRHVALSVGMIFSGKSSVRLLVECAHTCLHGRARCILSLCGVHKAQPIVPRAMMSKLTENGVKQRDKDAIKRCGEFGWREAAARVHRPSSAAHKKEHMKNWR